MRYPINCNDSRSVWTLKANPITGTVLVRWFNSPTKVYRYKASRSEILKLLWWSGDTCKGHWVNWHCIPA